jgi:hypothetical protein
MPAPALLMKMLPMIAGKSDGSGSLLPTAVGGAQLILGNIQRAKAKKMQPGQEDPMQVTAMQEYQRRANNAMTGANISNQMRDLAQMQGAGIRALSRGGNINQFGQVSRMQSKALNDILAQGQAQEESYRDMFNEQLKNVADRRLRLQTRAADAMSLRSEKNIAAGTQGIMAGLAKMNKKDSDINTPKMGDINTPISEKQAQENAMQPILGFGGQPLNLPLPSK